MGALGADRFDNTTAVEQCTRHKPLGCAIASYTHQYVACVLQVLHRDIGRKQGARRVRHRGREGALKQRALGVLRHNLGTGSRGVRRRPR